MQLLQAEDPNPIELLNPDSGNAFVFVCDHAGRRIPQQLGDLGVARHEFDRHIAWDIGAGELTRLMAARLNACAVLQRYSRLVVDCNRAPTMADFIPTISEATVIKGNQVINSSQRRQREAEIYRPYHQTIEALLDARSRLGVKTILVSVHSCTPVYLNFRRPWHIGILHDFDPIFSLSVLNAFMQDDDIVVGDNEPYRMHRSRDYTVPEHGETRSLPCVALEIRHDQLENSVLIEQWSRRIIEKLEIGQQQLSTAFV